MFEAMTTWQLWLTFGFALLIAEMFLPGVFMIWFGAAALIVGAVVWIVPIPWWIQAVLFAVLSGGFVLLYRRLKADYNTEASDQPMLNQRGAQMVGQVHVLHQGIENGRGKIKIGDALWSVTGPELPAGQRVRIKAINDMVLEVEAV